MGEAWESEERDDHGRFSGGGGGGGGAGALNPGVSYVSFAPDPSSPWTSGGGTEPEVASGPPLSPDDVEALTYYKGPSYMSLQPFLRGQGPEGTYTQEMVGKLDNIIENHPAAEDITAYRGLEAGTYADRIGNLAPGATLTDPAYQSVGDVQTGVSYAGAYTQVPAGRLLQIEVPEGHPMAMVSDKGMMGVSESNYEGILPRGSTFEVVGHSVTQTDPQFEGKAIPTTTVKLVR